MLGRLSECREHAEKALEIADRAGDMALSAAALNELGRQSYREGQLSRARDLYEQALALFRRVGDEGLVRDGAQQSRPDPQESVRVGCRGGPSDRGAEYYRSAGRLADTGRRR